MITNEMFRYSIDNKSQVTDPNGNRIVDLTSSIFARNAGIIQDYEIVKLNKTYVMRPDRVSLDMYETDQNAEFILKFSGISNPFTLDEDDVLMIPNESQAEGMMAYNTNQAEQDDIAANITQIRNYYKFVNQEYKSSSKSYDDLAKRKIPSGIIDVTKNRDFMVPYISEDGRTAVTIRGGKMFFGEDSGMVAANEADVPSNGVTKSVQSIIDDAITNLSNSNCIYNGTSIADFVRANINGKY